MDGDLMTTQELIYKEWLAKIENIKWAEIRYNKKAWSGLPTHRTFWRLQSQRVMQWLGWRVVLMVFRRTTETISEAEQLANLDKK